MFRIVSVAGVAFVVAVAAAQAAGPTTTRVNGSSAGRQANGASGGSTTALGVPQDGALIAGDGLFVAFDSSATDLAGGRDTNNARDVFVRDIASRVTRRVSVAAGGEQANGSSSVAGISAGGRIVLFTSHASNLASLDRNHEADVFVRDRARGSTSVISVRYGHRMNGENFADAISSNGRFVVFTNVRHLVGFAQRVFLRDRRRGPTFPIGRGNDFCPAAVVSNSGRYVVYACGEHDPSLAGAVLLDRQTGQSKLLDVRVGGVLANSTIPTAISPDGRYTVFTWTALDPSGSDVWSDVYEYDRVTEKYTRVTTPPPFTEHPWSGGVSNNGRYVAFSSESPNIVAGDTNGVADVFRRDLQTHTTIRISISAAGGQSTRRSIGGSISANGSLTVFQSADGSLVNGDTNGLQDVFVKDRFRE